MEYMVFDTETTGINKRTSQVIELGGFLLDENFKIKKAIHFYCNIDEIIPEDAVAIHGIDNEKLMKLSRGKFFEDYIFSKSMKFFTEPKDIIFVGYNVDFDICMVNNSLTINGYDKLDFGKSVRNIPKTPGVYKLDMMKAIRGLLHLPRYINLSQAVSMGTKHSVEEIKERFNLLCERNNLGARQGLHGALFDSYCTAILLGENSKYLYEV